MAHLLSPSSQIVSRSESSVETSAYLPSSYNPIIASTQIRKFLPTSTLPVTNPEPQGSQDSRNFFISLSILNTCLGK